MVIEERNWFSELVTQSDTSNKASFWFRQNSELDNNPIQNFLNVM